MEQLNLNKSRTFSQQVGDTFKFIRLNAGVLLRTHLFISLPIILLVAGAFFLIFNAYFSLLSTVNSGIFVDSVSASHDNTAWFVQNVLFPAFALLPVSANTILVVHLYEQNKDEKLSFDQIWEACRKWLPKLFLTKLIMLPLILGSLIPLLYIDSEPVRYISAFFLGIIGFIFYNLFTCVELLILQHDYTPFKAIRKSMKVMVRNFWLGLGLNLVALVIYLFMTFAMEFPAMILDTLENIAILDVDTGGVWLVAAAALRAFSGIAGYLIFMVPVVTTAILFFSIKEQNNRSNIMARIRSIGGQEEEDIYQEDEQY